MILIISTRYNIRYFKTHKHKKPHIFVKLITSQLCYQKFAFALLPPYIIKYKTCFQQYVIIHHLFLWYINHLKNVVYLCISRVTRLYENSLLVQRKKCAVLKRNTKLNKQYHQKYYAIVLQKFCHLNNIF